MSTTCPFPVHQGADNSCVCSTERRCLSRSKASTLSAAVGVLRAGDHLILEENSLRMLCPTICCTALAPECNFSAPDVERGPTVFSDFSLSTRAYSTHGYARAQVH